MENYDIIIVESGSGVIIANAAINEGMKVALVEMGKLGGQYLSEDQKMKEQSKTSLETVRRICVPQSLLRDLKWDLDVY